MAFGSGLGQALDCAYRGTRGGYCRGSSFGAMQRRAAYAGRFKLFAEPFHSTSFVS